ncbi:restriction endonuclease [Candidatus Pacearchaeota archaeon]|nr:restriction endonuclease [Candidatus Pacearchaeota archaeon]
MSQGILKDYFDSIAAKKLSVVESCPSRSNQHEFNGVSKLREILGDEKQTFPASFIFLSDDEDLKVHDTGFLTWYDARENHDIRTEYRLYFPSNEAMDFSSEGDLFLACKKSDHMTVVVAEANSTIASQLCWLFDISDVDGFDVKQIDASSKSIDFVTSRIIEQLGLSLDNTLANDSYLDNLIEHFPDGFPTTKIFSEYARNSFGEIELNKQDKVLLNWMNHEEMLFRTYERHLLSNRIHEGFEDVDDFIRLSLSVQNRRKSRAGHALENHLEKLFIMHKLKHQRNANTENKSKPDFLFPGQEEYHNPDFPVELLTMLGAKTSCKDRWRQILVEAAKIENKNLATLEPSISEDQTNEMSSHNLQLVIPLEIQESYTEKQRKKIMSISEFIALLKGKQQKQIRA